MYFVVCRRILNDVFVGRVRLAVASIDGINGDGKCPELNVLRRAGYGRAWPQG